MIFLLTVALSSMEYASVAFSLEHTFQQALESEMGQHQLVKHTIQSAHAAILSSSGGISDAELALIGETAADLMDADGGLCLSAGGVAYYSSLSTSPERAEPEAGRATYQVLENAADEVFLVVQSGFTQGDRTFTLVTERNIAQVFSEADDLQALCNRLYLIVLGACLLTAMGLAFALTRPLAALERVSRAFSEGNYSARVHLSGRDEVGALADTYNRMAETIADKIQQMADAVERQKRFTAGFAHELKTPMTSIIGYADTIYQRDLSPEETRQAAWYIVNEGMRLEALSFKLMDLIALEKNNFTLEETEIAVLLQETAETAVPLAEKRGIRFSCRAESGWARVEYDLFKTLLLNLIDNALKSGSRHVLLRGIVEQEGYRVCVSDDGRGIPPEDLEKITEAFYMVDKSRARKEHGAGLGLSLCERIAEIHGAKLHFSSAVQQGTTVSLVLRKVETEEARDGAG